MAEDDADLIRLSVPADAALAPLVEVTAAVLARRAGFSEEETSEARTAAAAAFAELVRSDGGAAVELEVRVTPHHLVARLTHGDAARTLELP